MATIGWVRGCQLGTWGGPRGLATLTDGAVTRVRLPQKIVPGLRIPSGSRACLMRVFKAIALSPK